MAPVIGISPSEFWEMSNYEFMVYHDEFFKKQEREWNEKVTHAIIAAYFHRADKFKWELKDGFMWEALHKQAEKAKTPETMLELIKRLNVQFGGNVE